MFTEGAEVRAVNYIVIGVCTRATSHSITNITIALHWHRNDDHHHHHHHYLFLLNGGSANKQARE